MARPAKSLRVSFSHELRAWTSEPRPERGPHGPLVGPSEPRGAGMGETPRWAVLASRGSDAELPALSDRRTTALGWTMPRLSCIACFKLLQLLYV